MYVHADMKMQQCDLFMMKTNFEGSSRNSKEQPKSKEEETKREREREREETYPRVL